MPQPVELGSRRQADNRIEIPTAVGRGLVQLTATNLLLQTDVAVKLFFHFSKMIRRADRAFETEEQVIMVPSKSRGVEPSSSQRRTRTRVQFNCAISMAIYMTVEACHTAAGHRRESVFALVKP